MTSAGMGTIAARRRASQAPVKLGRNPTKADVLRESRAGGDVVVKSVAKRPWYCRRLFGGFLVRREADFLERLQDTGHVPRLLSRHRCEFTLEWVEARRLYECDPHGITEEQAQAVRDALADIHARGVASGDIGRHDILLCDDGRVVLLDFATAMSVGSPPIIGRLFLWLWKRRDRRRVEKLVRRYRGKRELFRRQRAARLEREAGEDREA